MSLQHGFELIRETFVDEYNLKVLMYRHQATGAELVSVACDDENKVFGITFRTPPEDSTGVAHILEHSVLCGSRKYPLKEPFVELLKGSLQTFLNAFTYPDKTCYPVASQNLQDFYNLIDVYMDAVLHPLLDRHTFEQEAWHYELNSASAPLVYKGVVFNEMKGVYASADNLLEIHSQRSLFPDITYGHDYGGDPRHIPDLTWEQLVAFHRKYYHPSNARIFFYGNDNPDHRLKLMGDHLLGYDKMDVASSIPDQSPDSALPSRLTIPYPTDDSGDDALLYATINWRLKADLSPEEGLGLHLLDHILTETPASPLRKALIESGLGEDLAGTGLESHIREMYYSTGMKGIKPGNVDAVFALIEQTLESLVHEGIDPKTIEASINTEEFNFRELNTGNYPRGLSLMLSSLQTWLYDGDPLHGLRFLEPLNSIKKRLSQGEPFFENLIKKWLLENPHRSKVVLEPDPGLKARMDSEETQILAVEKSGWDDAKIEAVIRSTQELKKRQATPDNPDALRCLPGLTIRDLPRENKTIPIDITSVAGIPLVFHDILTQGISYLDVGFDLSSIPNELISLVGPWSKALLETGAGDEDFVALTQRIGRVTGGIDQELYTTTRVNDGTPQAWAFLRGKAMDERLPELLAIIRDVIQGARLDNRERIRQLVAEEKSALESSIIPSGHRFVASRLRAGYNSSDWIQEQLGGISYLYSLRKLARDIDSDWKSVLQQLRTLHGLMTARNNLLLNLTSAASSRKSAENFIQDYLGSLAEAIIPGRVNNRPLQSSAPEGLLIPSQVNYVGKSAGLKQAGISITGHDFVVNRYLRTAWLWDRVRVQGGAYGAFSMLDYRSGQLTMVSYRDPNSSATLDIYDQTAEYLRTLELNDEEIARAIVGAIGDMDTYLLPDARGFVSLGRHLACDTHEYRQKFREEILSTELKHFRGFADKVDYFSKNGQVVIMGGRDKIDQLTGIHLTPVL